MYVTSNLKPQLVQSAMEHYSIDGKTTHLAALGPALGFYAAHPS